jgi:3-isopropylmalate/(R)-2-methylmalate dehydratase small subunit
MAIAPVTEVSGTAVYVPGSDIDTDRIIPARFMKCVTFDGLGEFVFYDVRFHEDGTPKNHPIDEPRFAGANILVTGTNFGCGSSREHAPQSLYRHGFRAVIAESFAEIFFGNCTTLGIPCAAASADQIASLAAAVEADPSTPIRLDVAGRTLHYGDHSFPVEIPATAHDALTSGRWDPLGELLDNADAVHARAQAVGWA